MSSPHKYKTKDVCVCACVCVDLGIPSVQFFTNGGEECAEALHGQFMLVVTEELQHKFANNVQTEHLHFKELSDKSYTAQQSVVSL